MTETLNNQSKICTQCKKKLNLSEFYKQGDRHESHCKSCKKNKRQKRKKQSSQAPVKEAMILKPQAWNYPELGLAENEFLEIKELFEIFWEFKLRKQMKEESHAS